MAVRVVQLGSPRVTNEGLRIGAVRRPPRGVKKSEYAGRDYYDVWLPELAPSESLRAWALSKHANFSVGCYCEDESRCHRSVLIELLRSGGASRRTQKSL